MSLSSKAHGSACDKAGVTAGRAGMGCRDGRPSYCLGDFSAFIFSTLSERLSLYEGGLSVHSVTLVSVLALRLHPVLFLS